MKTYIIAFALSICMLFSCTKEGEIGPKGPKGDTGAAGQNGQDGQDGADGVDGAPGTPGTSSSVWTSIYTNQRIVASTPGILDSVTGKYIFHGAKEYAPANYERVQNTGVVLVYFRMSGIGNWKLSSYQIAVGSEGSGNSGDVQIAYTQESKSVIVQSRFQSILNSSVEMEMAKFDLKIILIEADSVTISSLRKRAPDMELNAVEVYLKSIKKN